MRIKAETMLLEIPDWACLTELQSKRCGSTLQGVEVEHTARGQETITGYANMQERRAANRGSSGC